MIKNNKGITLMSLIITIVVMVILLSIVGYFSLDSVKNTYIANEKKEMADVVQYVSALKVKLLLGDFNVNDNFENIESKIVTTEAMHLIASDLSVNEMNKIKSVNEDLELDENYKYLFITSKDLNNSQIYKTDVIVKDAKNDYIINYFTGTVIGLYDGGKRIEISGTIKGINDIKNNLY